MKIRLYCIFIIFFSTTGEYFTSAQSYKSDWLKGIGSSIPDDCETITVDNGGNFLAVSYLPDFGDIDPGAGVVNTIGTVIAKYSSSCEYIWSRNLSTSIYNLSVYQILDDDSGNIYIFGKFGGSVDFDTGPGVAILTSLDSLEMDNFVAKYDRDFNYLWANRSGGLSPVFVSYGNNINVDKNRNVYLASHFTDTGYFHNTRDSMYAVSKGKADVYFLKYDKNGQLLFVKTIQGSTSSNATSIITDDFGNLYVTGFIESGPHDFEPDTGVAFLISNAITYRNGFIAKYDSSGKYLWANAYNSSIQVHPYNMAIDKLNNKYVVGSFVDDAYFGKDMNNDSVKLTGTDYDGFISKYNANDDLLWVKKLSNLILDYVEIFSIAIDSSFNIIVGGYFTGVYGPVDFDPGPESKLFTSQGYYDAFVAVYDSSGKYIWANTIGGKDADICEDVAVYGNDIYAVGKFTDTAYFQTTPDTISLVSKQSSGAFFRDIFFAKYKYQPTSIYEPKQTFQRVVIFPNPATGRVNINGDFMYPASIKMYDLAGRIISNHILDSPYQAVNSEGLQAGMYLIELRDLSGEKFFGKLAVR